MDGKRLAPVFNDLSGADQWKLRLAAWSTALTGIVRDDTKAHPWKYPFYAVYLTGLLAPYPLPGAGMAIILLSVGALRLSNSPWAQWAKGRLGKAFNTETVMRDFAKHITPDASRDPARFRVSSFSLFRATTGVMVRDSWLATRYAFRALAG